MPVPWGQRAQVTAAWPTQVVVLVGREAGDQVARAGAESEERLLDHEVAAGFDGGARGEERDGVSGVVVVDAPPDHVDRVRLVEVLQLHPVAGGRCRTTRSR